MENNIGIIELEKALKAPLEYVLYFEDKGYGVPHNYLIVPTNNETEFILLAMITSKVDKRINFHKHNKKELESLEHVSPLELDFLTQDSLIDCNDIHVKSKEDILQMNKLKLLKNNIPKELIERISKKINSSPRHKPSLKKKIDLSKLAKCNNM